VASGVSRPLGSLPIINRWVDVPTDWDVRGKGTRPCREYQTAITDFLASQFYGYFCLYRRDKFSKSVDVSLLTFGRLMSTIVDVPHR
jgi:hypothetical protein